VQGTLSTATTARRGALNARRKFLRIFPGGFYSQKYLDWERGYKWEAHQEWEARLSRSVHRELIIAGQFEEIAARAIRIESRTNLLFSFEKMALRDGVRSPEGARKFSASLYDLLYGPEPDQIKFERWCEAVSSLPRKQTRVLTWPVVTVFGFIALPLRHMYFKPQVTRRAAEAYGVELAYQSKPAWTPYANLLRLAKTVRQDLSDLKPRDMIDIQSFLWVQGSEEYAE
jgi:hypothetical protein